MQRRYRGWEEGISGWVLTLRSKKGSAAIFLPEGSKDSQFQATWYAAATFWCQQSPISSCLFHNHRSLARVSRSVLSFCFSFLWLDGPLLSYSQLFPLTILHLEDSGWSYIMCTSSYYSKDCCILSPICTCCFPPGYWSRKWAHGRLCVEQTEAAMKADTAVAGRLHVLEEFLQWTDGQITENKLWLFDNPCKVFQTDCFQTAGYQCAERIKKILGKAQVRLWVLSVVFKITHLEEHKGAPVRQSTTTVKISPFPFFADNTFVMIAGQNFEDGNISSC